MKKTDLYKNEGHKINTRVKQAGVPGRFGEAGAAVPDRREQRRMDQAAGLVPFAIKLNASLVTELHAAAQARQLPLNELVTELLRKALDAK